MHNNVKNTKKQYNRKRNVILNFRVTEEERELINKRIELSGMARGDFFIQSCLHQKIITYGNVKTFSAIKQQIEIINKHLQKINKSEELDIKVLESLRAISEILAGLNEE